MEQIQRGLAEADTGTRRGNGAGKPKDKDNPTGRKDGDGQEAVVDVGALKKGMPKAIKLEKELADARSDASAFYKKFAKECGLNTAQLKKAAKAYADEDTEAERRKADQLSLIFVECGA
jgi:hypothetical protein